MDQKDKAIKTALIAIGVMAFAMIAYYWVHWRTWKTENDINFSEKVDAGGKQEKSEFAGVWSASDPIEGLNKRLQFFSLNKNDDGSGAYFGTAKVDPIASETDSPIYLKCNDVNIGDKDFFVKCNEPTVGQISFVGEWSRGASGIQVSGKVLWTKDGNEISNKATTLTHTSN